MSENKKSLSKLAKVKKLAAQVHSDIRYITVGTIEGSKRILEYAVATEQGLFYYHYDNNKLSLITHVLWADVKEIKVDYLAFRTNLTLNGQNYRLTNEGKKIFELAEEKSEAKIEKIHRNWHQKIMGFRSRKPWKMIVAVITYLLLINIITSIANENDKTFDEMEQVRPEETVTKILISDEEKEEEQKDERKRVEETAKEDTKKAEEEQKVKDTKEAVAKEKAQIEKQEKEEAEIEETEKQSFANSDKDCGDFSNHNEVLAFWYENGFSTENDPHNLDADNDGLPCSIAQSEYDTNTSNKDSSDSLSSETTPSPSFSIYYDNCTAVRDAGADPVYIGEPGYGSHLDRDGDGVGCE